MGGTGTGTQQRQALRRTWCSAVILSNSSTQQTPRSARTRAPASRANAPLTGSRMTEAVRPALLEEGPHTYSPLGAALAAACNKHMPRLRIDKGITASVSHLQRGSQHLPRLPTKKPLHVWIFGSLECSHCTYIFSCTRPAAHTTQQRLQSCFG